MARYPLVISTMLLLSLFTVVEVQNELELELIQERIISDMDGDGVLDYLDSYPRDQAVTIGHCGNQRIRKQR